MKIYDNYWRLKIIDRKNQPTASAGLLIVSAFNKGVNGVSLAPVYFARSLAITRELSVPENQHISRLPKKYHPFDLQSSSTVYETIFSRLEVTCASYICI